MQSTTIAGHRDIQPVHTTLIGSGTPGWRLSARRAARPSAAIPRNRAASVHELELIEVTRLCGHLIPCCPGIMRVGSKATLPVECLSIADHAAVNHTSLPMSALAMHNNTIQITQACQPGIAFEFRRRPDVLIFLA
eukprot:302265-Pelagomonas_calceolata.AAC.4